MRLIDADALEARILTDAPDFMDGGSSITKAFILAMIRTRSVTPTVDDAVRVVRCKDCRFVECEGRGGNLVCDLTGFSHKPGFFCADGERKEV